MISRSASSTRSWKPAPGAEAVRARLARAREDPGHVGLGDLGPVAEDDQPLDQVAQLAHVARPVVAPAALSSASRRELHGPAPVALAASSARKCVAQHGQVLASCSRSGGSVHRHHVEPVVEVLAEAARLRPRPRGPCWWRRRPARRTLSVCGAPDRARTRPPAARAAAWPAWPRAMSPTSSRKSVPPSASSNLPAARRHGAGEGPLLVAEQLALDELGGHGRAVELHERGVARAASARAARAPPAPCPCRSRR